MEYVSDEHDTGVNMDTLQVARAIDWTPSFRNQLLPSDEELDQWCRTAVERGIGQLLINPMFLEKAKKRLRNTGVKIFCPLEPATMGQGALSVKLAMLPELVRLGAEEIDTLMNFYAFQNEKYDQVENEIRQIVTQAKKLKKDLVVKVIIETGLWSETRIKKAAELVSRAGADYIKTCLGTGPRGVTERDVELLQEAVGDRTGIKASGGIRNGTQAVRLLELGATRLGISQAIQVLDSI
jgi:deoxyribose-phosphate aldolase